MERQHQGKQVDIRLHSSIRHPGQVKETHEFQLTGRLIEKRGTSYLQYVEKQDGTIETIVKLDPKDALIMRKGAVQMRLPFSMESRRMGSYGSGPATFDLHVQTDHLQFTKEQEGQGGEFHVQYRLLDGKSLLGTYHLTITYTEGKS
ncbi:DUF1934 domain-containing protein [Sporosarcina sp. 179-K 3D1 HS]|uniref:DUF1934 domain-containing protein n=1 Tax=Sporosarcina sp. 179-K 3D1 HS TaxID=3232169 RepID=UPI0039A345C5